MTYRDGRTGVGGWPCVVEFTRAGETELGAERGAAPVLRVLVGTLVAALVTAGASPAGAAALWSLSPSPNPTGAVATVLYGVSCPSSGSCFAVGYHSTVSGVRSLVEHWNGSNWSIMASPDPKGTIQDYLRGVSCVSTTSCFAVGNYSTVAIGSDTVVEHWNGKRWSILRSPDPAGASSTILRGVSCPSARSCFAVGEYSLNSTTRTLAEHWNGQRWSIVASPNPSGSSVSALNAVSCPTTGSCFAVGSRGSTSSKGLVEHWNGNSWGFLLSPNRSSATSSTLYAIACPSARSCFAVGHFSRRGGIFDTQVEHWNGTQWGLMAAPDIAVSNNTSLTGIACPSTRSCFAVGYFLTPSPQIGGSVVEHWNGSYWNTMPRPDAGIGSDPTLAGVSCPATSNCFAVGNYLSFSSVTGTLIERYS